ncbi:MAG TPA: hypothetical protein VKS03_09385 [Thermoanaerobaculia bacterium]|nr:hypothetical protein [Thermoanaerobaculia bacterium]
MKASTKTLLASAGVLLLTTLHHLYGAFLYKTPWRNHVALIALPVLLVLVVTHEIHRRQPATPLGRASLFLFAALTLAVPVGMIGFFEGGYNHLVKDLLFFGGLPAAALDRLFPDSVYEMPDNLLFEASGVLQFFVGLYAARWLGRLWRERSAEQSRRTEEDRQAA